LVKYLLTISLLLSINIYGDSSLDDDLGGFDEEVVVENSNDELDGFDDEVLTTTEEIPYVEEKESIFTLSGDLTFKTSLGYHNHKVDGIKYNSINQAQISLYLQLDTKISKNWKLRVSGDAFYDAIYDIKNYNYRDEILDDYRTQLRFDDVYLEGQLSDNLDLKIGRQIVVWGKSDSIRVTDVINPLDNRLPGMTDIEDLRLSVGMLKLDYYVGSWNFSGMVIGENRISLEATPRGEFSNIDNIFQVQGGVPDPFLELVTPKNSLKNLQYAVAINGVFSGWDLSFYGANVLDQKSHFNKMATPTTPLSSIKRVFSKVNMLGGAINIARGSWLLKSEIAYINNIIYNSTVDKKNRLDTLVGFDYMGFKDSTISLEVVNRHIFNYEKQMAIQSDFVDRNEFQTALRVTHSFLNDTLNTTALVSMFGSSFENGGFARIWAKYDIADGITSNFGIVDYIGGDKPFMESNKDNDRIFADITYSF